MQRTDRKQCPILLDTDCYFKPIDDGGKKCMLNTLAECLSMWLRELTVHMTKSPDGTDLTQEEMVAYLTERNPHRKTGMKTRTGARSVLAMCVCMCSPLRLGQLANMIRLLFSCARCSRHRCTVYHAPVFFFLRTRLLLSENAEHMMCLAGTLLSPSLLMQTLATTFLRRCW